MRFKCFEGRMNSDGFIDFLKALHSDSGKPVFVIVDGASYHSSRKVKDYVKSTEGKVELFKLPAYSPELNPDEQVWNQAKSKIGKMAIESKSMMHKAVLGAMRSIQKSKQLIKAFFKLEHTKYAQV
jgi:transposase